jgi:hypothetical protein
VYSLGRSQPGVEPLTGQSTPRHNRGPGLPALFLFDEFAAGEPVGPHHLGFDRASDLGAGPFKDGLRASVEGVRPTMPFSQGRVWRFDAVWP